MGTLRRLSGAVVVVVACSVSACGSSAPTRPTTAVLTGTWTGGLVGRGPCAGDWSALTLTLNASGSGTLETKDGQQFPVSDVTQDGTRSLAVSVPPGTGECQTVLLTISDLQMASPARVAGFTGSVTGRCCGTLQATFRFTRA